MDIAYTDLCLHELRRSEHKRELRRPENKQLNDQTFLTGTAWNKIRLNAKQNLTGFHALLLHPVPRKRELRRPENKQLDGQTFLTGTAWNKISEAKLDWVSCVGSSSGSTGAPEITVADEHLSPCVWLWSESTHT